MRERGYYSIRTGKNPDGARLNIDNLKRLIKSVYSSLSDKGYFQEYFGYECVDEGMVRGKLGDDINGALLVGIRKDNLWPIYDNIINYTEDDLFDIIEYIFDHTSKGIDGYYHNFANCGYHYSTFNKQDGQSDYRNAINPILGIYEQGYVLSEEGEILQLPEAGMAPLIDANLPSYDPDNVDNRVNKAVNRFRKHRASLEDRRYALRDLADVLEFLRPKVKNIITNKDEADIFNLANNFGIRHHNEKQKSNYDTAIWYSWMFYYYLATIHACIRLLKNDEIRNA